MNQCRFCSTQLQHVFVDLGVSPVSNANLREEDLDKGESFYPLQVYLCDACLLAQLPQFHAPEEIFSSDYAYFSSYTDSWLQHAKRYTEAMIPRFDLDISSQVVEIASNDGYLLQYFVERGIPALGIEPAANVADVAIKERNVPTWVRFFGTDTAKEIVAEQGPADLMLGNNVLAHVPDLNDFVAGVAIALAPNGVVTFEFPHLLRLIEENQFDTVYHEHFSYFSLLAVQKIFAHHGLTVFDVEELSTHGGSLRVYSQLTATGSHSIAAAVSELIERETRDGLAGLERYQAFDEQVRETKRKLLEFLIQAKRDGRTIAGYGAPAKGNTLLNYCGVGRDFIDYTVDRNPHKQGRYLPGTRIPVYAPDRLAETKPDLVFILPWNLKDEIAKNMSHVREWGGEFLVAIPEVTAF